MGQKNINSIKNRNLTKAQIQENKLRAKLEKEIREELNAQVVEDDGTRADLQWSVELDDGTRFDSYTKSVTKPEYISVIQNIVRASSGDQAVRMPTVDSNGETKFVVIGAMQMIKAKTSITVTNNGFGEEFTL